MATLKILSINREAGIIEVEFDGTAELRIAVPIPFDKDGKVPEGDTLLLHLMQHYPSEQIALRHRLFTSNTDHIKALVGVPIDVTQTKQTLDTAKADGTLHQLLNIQAPAAATQTAEAIHPFHGDVEEL